MQIDRRIMLYAITLLLSACGGTSVVLMPDDQGKVGQVIVKNQHGEQELNQAQHSSEVNSADKAPEQPKILSKEDIRAQFADVLAIHPQSPEHFNLQNFESGSADVNPYNEELDKIAAEIVKRKSCDIIVIGHCDTVGSNADNEKVSKARATNVKDALIERGVQKNCIGDIRFYGESDLIEPTGDNTNEPLNRRVEVEIR